MIGQPAVAWPFSLGCPRRALQVPSFAGKPRPKAFPHQLRLAMSLESAAYYPSLDNPGYMCHFDAEMSYRTCAQVTK
jgi:hypothetical protein